MKIALSQMDIVWEDRQANYEKAALFAQKAFTAGANLLLFPEMSFTGFSMHTEKTAETCPYESTEKMKALSRRYPGMAIGFGFAARREDSPKALNCLEVVQDGEVLMHYEKLHPFTFGEEGRYFQAGSKLAACEICGVATGAFICYDLRFPEIFQISSRSNALIFVLANWPAERAAHWKLLLQARAVENQCYIAGVNRIGEGGGLHYEPGSLVFDPLGNPVETTTYSVGEQGESLLLAQIEPQEVRRVRSAFPLKADRREALYREWYV